MYEVERIAKQSELVIVPDNFRMHDTAHDTLTKDSVSIRDKKSKFINEKSNHFIDIGLFVQDRNLEY